MNRDEPSSLEPARGLSPLGVMILVGLLAFLGGIAATVALVQTRGAPWLPAAHDAPAPEPSPSAPSPPPLPAGTDLATLNVREQLLAGRLDAIQAQVVRVEGDARVAARQAARAESLLIAISARRLLDRGEPLGELEGQLRDRFGETHPEANAAVLRASAEPVTIEDLRVALDAIAPRLAAGGADEALWTRARRIVNDLIVLRQETSPSPRPSDRLRRARRVLDAGQVEAALAEVTHMPGAANAQSWIAAARRYIAARRALGELELAAMRGAEPVPAPEPEPAPADDTQF